METRLLWRLAVPAERPLAKTNAQTHHRLQPPHPQRRVTCKLFVIDHVVNVKKLALPPTSPTRSTVSTSLQTRKTKEDYADILADLDRLSRELLLTHRLQAGKLFLDRFFGGSAHAYHDKNPDKEASFVEFAKVCKDELSAAGLTNNLARQSILARIAWDGLPPAVREGLKFNHIVTLARVDEPTMRARLAMDATRQGWTVLQLEDAIHRAEDGHYYDIDPDTPGTQPPPLPDEPQVATYQPGRLVTQLVKAGKELQAWEQAWASVDGSKLRGAQRLRMHQALATLKAQVARLEGQLGPSDVASANT